MTRKKLRADAGLSFASVFLLDCRFASAMAVKAPALKVCSGHARFYRLYWPFKNSVAYDFKVNT